MLSVLFVGAVVACTGSDPEIFPPNGNPSTNGDGGAGGSTNDAGGSDSGSTNSTTDGGGSDSGDGGSLHPRSVSCDATSICTGTDKCCGQGNDWIPAVCKADCGGAYSLWCDDAKDCETGQVCCYVTDGGARATASFCAASCRPEKDEHQLCNSATECSPPGQVCTPISEFSPSGLSRCN